jgi:hypothetical protein
MRRFPLCAVLLGLTSALLATEPAAAQSIQVPATAPVAAAANGQFQPRPVSNDLPRLGVGFKVSTLGFGFQVGTALASRINIRGGANFFTYKDSLTEDGVTYNGTLTLKSVEAKVDLFVAGGFRVTPGLLLYNDNNLAATASVLGGQSFTLNSIRYFSSVTSPITGTAALALNKTAPTLAIGFGNLLPRSGRHFSVSTDIGVVFQGSPQFALNLGGSGCLTSVATSCQPINLLPGATANIQAEQQKISDDLKPFKYYPELSVTFGWSF